MIDRNFDGEDPEQIFLDRFKLYANDIFRKVDENRLPKFQVNDSCHYDKHKHHGSAYPDS